MFCEKCGNNLVEGATFCEKCGAPVKAKANVSANPINDLADKAYDAIPKLSFLEKQTALGLSWGKLATILSVVVVMMLLVFGSWLKLDMKYGRGMGAMMGSVNDIAGAMQVNLFTFVPFVSSLGDMGVPGGAVAFAWIITLAIIATVVLYGWYLKDLFTGKNKSDFAIYASIATFAIVVILLIVELILNIQVSSESDGVVKKIIGSCLPLWLCLIGSVATAYLAKNTERE